MEREEFKALCQNVLMQVEANLEEGRSIGGVIGMFLGDFAYALREYNATDGANANELSDQIAQMYIALQMAQLHYDISDEQVRNSLKKLLTE